MGPVKEVAVRLPRFQIGWLMARRGHHRPQCRVGPGALEVMALHSEFMEMCVVGALPMANILAIGGFLLWTRPDLRDRFWWASSFSVAWL